MCLSFDTSPIFYSNQFQTTISPSPDVPSVVGKGNRYLPY